jgi:hypothetical protein
MRTCLTCKTDNAEADCLTCHGPEWLNWTDNDESIIDVVKTILVDPPFAVHPSNWQLKDTCAPHLHYLDPNVEKVMNRLADRAAAGLLKYGTDTTRQDLTRAQWLRHAQEEALDMAVYLERLIQDA